MSINVGMGVSQDDNLMKAAKKAAQEAKDQLGGKKPKLLMFFCTYTYPEDQYQRSQEEIYRIFEDKGVPLVGGTTLGFFAKDKYYFDVSLFGKTMGTALKAMGKVFKPLKFTGACVLALESDSLNISVGLGTDSFQEPYSAGEKAVQEAFSSLSQRKISIDEPINSFLITPGLDKSGKSFDTDIIKGIISGSKYHLRILGGGLCGGISEQSPFMGSAFYNGGVYRESVIFIALNSEFKVGFGIGNSIDPVAKIGLITKMRNKRTIEEINGRPAAEVVFEVVKKHLDIKKEDFLKTPGITGLAGFALVFPDPTGKFFWPNLPVVITDEKYVEMTHSGLEKGMLLTLAKGDKESCIEANVNATKLMIEEVGTKDFNFIMFFSCAARGIVMGKDYVHEIKQIKNILGKKDLPVFGICSNGEQGFYKIGSPVATVFIIAMLGISNVIRK